MSNFFNPLQLALKPLFERAKNEDSAFAEEVKTKTERTEKPKSWEECCEFVLGEAYEYASKHRDGNFGMAGMADDDLVGLIKHYYDEDDIKINKVGGAKASVATTSTTTPKATAPTKKESKSKTTKKENKVATPKIEIKVETKPLSKADLKKGADCYDMFSALFES